jgi:hypothetical protein
VIIRGVDKMKYRLGSLVVLLVVFWVAGYAHAWTPLPVKDDQNVFMPGSQPGEGGNSETPGKCDNCHTEPITSNWRGSMMAQAARDPLWLSCMTVADQDSIWALGNPNAGDICIRCHSPEGWLGGHSDPTNGDALAGVDFDGVQCDFCHRMLDSIAAEGQPDVPTDTGGAATLADDTYARDVSVLSTLTLFDGSPFFDTSADLPDWYGGYPSYNLGMSGQYFVDPGNAKRGPFSDAAARHKMYYSRYHKSSTFCHTCHDVSNPILASVLSGDPALPEEQVASSYYHVERTSSEFILSAYGLDGGAATRGGVADSGVTWATKCQDCHMRDVTGVGCNKRGVQTRTDLPLHDLTGGNQWISRILASADPNSAYYDDYNYQILAGNKYPGASIDVGGVLNFGSELWAGAERAVQQIQMAATLETVADTTSVALKVVNNTGHKLISGFPEGRRMFLNVKFYDSTGDLIGEVNSYEPLVTTIGADGNEHYVSGGILTKTRDDLVWEAEMSSSLTGEDKSFHFALATGRYKDNRIPPKGFDTANMASRLAQPVWGGNPMSGYFTPEEYLGGYDEVTVAKPAGTAYWTATLYYQTTSKEYIEFLRDEINGAGGTLEGTGAGGDEPYLIQTDSFFTNLKGWGNAIYDLWLHNGGAAPVMMAQVGYMPAPPCEAPVAPQNPQSAYAKKRGGSINVTWDTPLGTPLAASYNIYYSVAGKFNLITSTTQTSYNDRNVVSGQTYCYVISAVSDCGAEGPYSAETCTTAPAR